MPSKINLKNIIKSAVQNDESAIAKLISLAENNTKKTSAIEKLLMKKKCKSDSYVIGITGAMGCGKSTLVNALIGIARSNNKSVAVVAIDPTSVTSGGAILGDRIRMTSNSSDKKVFIRSMASRGELGGVSAATSVTVDILVASGRDIVFVETVGVGQLDIKVKDIVDTTVVVLTPVSGDDIQFMKAGIMEIADIFVVNKSDEPDASRLIQLLTNYVYEEYCNCEWIPPVVSTVAINNKGVNELFEKLKEHKNFILRNKIPTLRRD